MPRIVMPLYHLIMILFSLRMLRTEENPNVLEPIHYLLYTNDVPTFEQNITAISTDDTTTMAIGENSTESK